METKTCSRCQFDKDVDQFDNDSSRKDGRYPYCKECSKAAKRTSNAKLKAENPEEWARRRAEYVLRYKERHPERIKETERRVGLKRKYGITLEEYNDILIQQGGCCAICGYVPHPDQNFPVDHCHDSGRVRAILCPKCNLGLGNFNEDPDLLEAAAEYLRRC